MPSFGERLRTLREKAGMSQQELADASGTSQKAISAWELDTREPSIGNVQKLCDSLGVDCSEFFTKPAKKKGKTE